MWTPEMITNKPPMDKTPDEKQQQNQYLTYSENASNPQQVDKYGQTMTGQSTMQSNYQYGATAQYGQHVGILPYKVYHQPEQSQYGGAPIPRAMNLNYPQQYHTTQPIQYVDAHPPPLTDNSHPQEHIPNHGYSSYFPPDQANKEKDRIEQLERKMEAFMNQQQTQFVDNRNMMRKQGVLIGS